MGEEEHQHIELGNAFSPPTPYSNFTLGLYHGSTSA